MCVCVFGGGAGSSLNISILSSHLIEEQKRTTTVHCYRYSDPTVFFNCYVAENRIVVLTRRLQSSKLCFIPFSPTQHRG